MSKNSNLVYATDRGRVKAQPEASKTLGSGGGDGIIRIRRETSGRKGNAVTTLQGLEGTQAELRALATLLKRLCGSGGSLKNGILEIQGDHREKIASFLGERGYKVKMAGG